MIYVMNFVGNKVSENEEDITGVQDRQYDVELIKNLKSKFDDRAEYEITLNYNEDGFVYQIVIE